MFRRLLKLYQNQFSKPIYKMVVLNHRMISITTNLGNEYATEKNNEDNGETDFCGTELDLLDGSIDDPNNSYHLTKHFAPVDIDIDDDNEDEFNEKPGDYEEQLKKDIRLPYESEYKYNGIKVFVPQSKMLEGTLRNKLLITVDLPDDMRIIPFESKKN